MKQTKTAGINFILVTVLIDAISFGIVIPVFPDLIKTMQGCDDGAAAVISAWLMAVFAIAQFVFSPVQGSLSDRFGRRPILLASLFGFGLDYILLAFAPSIEWLFVGRIIAGILGASYTTALAYVADISTEENKAKNYGKLGAAFGLGFILGPGIGGALGELDLKLPFILGAVLSLVNWLYGYFILPESRKPENINRFEKKSFIPGISLVQAVKYKTILGLMLSFFLLYLAAQAVMTNWSFYTIHKFDWGKTQIGISITVVGLMVAFVQGFLVRIVNPKLGNHRSVTLGLLLYAVGMLGFGLAPAGWVMLVSIIPYCLGGINGPAMQAMMSNHVPANEQGKLQGVITSMQSLTSILGPIIMGGLFDYFTSEGNPYIPGAAFIAGTVLILTAWVIAIVSMKKQGIYHS
jgi:DHA1 family tetracycline resistance protein-like MFS transporter